MKWDSVYFFCMLAAKTVYSVSEAMELPHVMCPDFILHTGLDRFYSFINNQHVTLPSNHSQNPNEENQSRRLKFNWTRRLDTQRQKAENEIKQSMIGVPRKQGAMHRSTTFLQFVLYTNGHNVTVQTHCVLTGNDAPQDPCQLNKARLRWMFQRLHPVSASKICWLHVAAVISSCIVLHCIVGQ